MLRYKEYVVTRRKDCIYVNGMKAHIAEHDKFLYSTDRAGICAKGGAKGLYKLMKECAKNQSSEMHIRTADSIIHKVLEVGEPK